MYSAANYRFLRAAAVLALLISVGFIVYGLVVANWWIVGMFLVTALASFSLYPALMSKPQREHAALRSAKSE
ncbi:MAG TPA: hypothetical protein H9830_02840 [Candidatus Agrococcus pullicola]|uniref:Uncharacterized protein n=1 Tax=Candidatus Agrococcus pullicola TaxID=2838429 RepID=A0A9D1YT07_9MICO|nr:hypothetical protein [Candidatus Agrococcus pullicola]